jgi:hypothetical protein
MPRDRHPSPPAWCRGPYARSAWANGYAAVTRLMEWDEGFGSMLAQLAMFASAYVGAVHENRPATEMEERRLCARALMADYMLLDLEMVGVPGTIRADGMDRDVAALCDVPSLQ